MKRILYLFFCLGFATWSVHPQAVEGTGDSSSNLLGVIFDKVKDRENVSWINEDDQQALNINGYLHNIGSSGQLIISAMNPITDASQHAAALARAMAIWEDTKAFDKIEYKADAVNSFVYQPRMGLQWSPSVLSGGYWDNRQIDAYVKVENPEDVKMRFSWLVSTLDDESSTNWAIPYSEASLYLPPAGYKWHHTPFWKRTVPEEYETYVPYSWTEEDETWKLKDLAYSLSITENQLDAFAAIPRETKGKYIADLILDSYKIVDAPGQNRSYR